MKKSMYSIAQEASREAESVPAGSPAPVPSEDAEAWGDVLSAADLARDQQDVLECPVDLATALRDNMAVVNLQSESTKPNEDRLKGGLDTLHLSLVVEWGLRWETTKKLLDQCQAKAKIGTDEESYFRIGDTPIRWTP